MRIPRNESALRRFWRTAWRLWRRDTKHAGSKGRRTRGELARARKRERQARRYARLCQKRKKHRWKGARP